MRAHFLSRSILQNKTNNITWKNNDNATGNHVKNANSFSRKQQQQRRADCNVIISTILTCVRTQQQCKVVATSRYIVNPYHMAKALSAVCTSMHGWQCTLCTRRWTTAEIRLEVRIIWMHASMHDVGTDRRPAIRVNCRTVILFDVLSG